jgi:hypothetical protein
MKPEVLLKAFVLHQSEDAFRELVAGTVDQVYTCALRIVPGPGRLAEETVLRVYWDLARTAPRLSDDVVLATWLREHTCRSAVKVLQEEAYAVDRAALKKERHGPSTFADRQAAPPGLAIRVSQGILLNAARSKSLWFLLPRVVWPAWMRPAYIGAGAVCALGIIVLCNVPHHRPNPIIPAPEMRMTPVSFAQLAGPGEGGIAPPASRTSSTITETKRTPP